MKLKYIFILFCLYSKFTFSAAENESVLNLINFLAGNSNKKEKLKITRLQTDNENPIDRANRFITLAAKINNIKLTKKAIFLGADVNKDIQYGCSHTPIFWALTFYNKEVAKFLLKNGAIITLRPYVESLIDRDKLKNNLKFTKQVIDEVILEENNFSFPKFLGIKSFLSDLPEEITQEVSLYLYSLPQEELEELKELSQTIEENIK